MTITEVVRDPQRMFELLTSPDKVVNSILTANDDILYISWVYNDVEVEIEPSTGPFLGQLTDKLAGYGLSTYITSFVFGGPKFDAYKYIKPDGCESCVCKIKGIRLNASATERIHFECARKLVRGEIPPTFVSFDAIRRTALHDVVTPAECKVCEPVYSKRRFVAIDKSYPMEHARKMILVPQGCIKSTIKDECGAGSSNDNYLNTSSEVVRLDDEMNKILNSSELDDRQKYSIYQQVLQRLRRSGSIACNELSMITVDGVRARGVVGTRYEHSSARVVGEARKKAHSVNIVDLVNEAVRRRKRPPSCSFDQFVRVLRKAHVPLEFIGNNKLHLTVATASNNNNKLASKGSTNDEDDDDNDEKDYDGEKTLDLNNLTFLKYRKGDKKRKRGSSSRAAIVDTTVDDSIKIRTSSTKRTEARPYKMAASQRVNTESSSVLDTLINRMPFKMHIPGYQFLGERLVRGEKPSG
ncbi:hypothetical protein TSAR_013591 [Trichomalopsis sarcophagae]|uniref:Uncharacterized protein n=1 Tax=Trichomalopsis sarcophagae TaxID=543379 RepID=A0A232EED2_9HYME|nr:hypothetical protein TSAR_013591 [Trichomalopsis sarcophagae]